MSRPTPGLTWAAAGISTVWLAAVSGGLGYVIQYEGTPGPSGSAPRTWPVGTTLTSPAGRPLLLLMAHPRCPCTRASLDELARLVAYAPGRFDARVVFYAPGEAPDDWSQTGIFRGAQSIPGVQAVLDRDGAESRRFHAETSGHALLYGADGRLLFSGGITPARGHAGGSAGRDALETILDGGRPAVNATPVFGCALRDAPTATGEKIP